MGAVLSFIFIALGVSLVGLSVLRVIIYCRDSTADDTLKGKFVGWLRDFMYNPDSTPVFCIIIGCLLILLGALVSVRFC